MSKTKDNLINNRNLHLEIRKIFQEHNYDIRLDPTLNQLFYISIVMEARHILSFTIEDRQCSDTNWLQIETFIKPFKKTLIWDYDFQESYENNEELINKLVTIELEIQNFNKSLVIPKLGIES